MVTSRRVHELVHQYDPLAKKLAMQYRMAPYDDSLQEARLGLIIAATEFRPQRGAFGPFARIVITNRLNGLYHAERKWRIMQSLEMLDGMVPEGCERLGLIELLEAFKDVAQQLTKDERELVRLRLLGKSQQTCAELLHVSQPTVSRLLTGVRDKLSDSLMLPRRDQHEERRLH